MRSLAERSAMSRRIAVFARPPVPGRVKTRLAPALTPEEACSLYRACLADALDAVREAPADERWLYWADPPGSIDPLDVSGFRAAEQRGATLGERLAAAFEELLRAPEDRAVVLGADCPELDATRLGRALERLDAADAVFGPTRDGGYYLVALRRRAPTLFAEVEWSTPRALAQTLERARAAGLRTEPLDPLEDLDTPEDLVRLVARWIPRSGASGPAGAARHARRALRELGLLP